MSEEDQDKFVHLEKLREAEKQHERWQAYIHKIDDAVVSSGSAAIRNLFLMNGGALVAMLTFISALLGGEEPKAYGANLLGPMFWFAIGLALAAVASAGVYLSNLCQSMAAHSYDFVWNHPFIEKDKNSYKWETAGAFFHYFTIFIGLLLLSFFIYGFFEVKCVFDKGFIMTTDQATPPSTPAAPPAPADHTPPAP